MLEGYRRQHSLATFRSKRHRSGHSFWNMGQFVVRHLLHPILRDAGERREATISFGPGDAIDQRLICSYSDDVIARLSSSPYQRGAGEFGMSCCLNPGLRRLSLYYGREPVSALHDPDEARAKPQPPLPRMQIL